MEAAVSSSLGAMGPLLRKLDLLLAPEYRLRKPLRDGVELLKEDLQEISSALVELSTLETPTLRAKCWMQEARELSYLVDDFVDDMMRTRSDTGSKMRSVYRHRVGRVKIAQLPEPPWRGTRIARIIQLRALLRQASERYERYQLDACCSSSGHMITGYGRAPTLYGDAANLFGIEDSRTKLAEMLNVEAEQRLKVVSIVGPAGVGKTTLAKEIFHELGGQFELRAFVRASRKLDMRRLLGSILSQVWPHRRLPLVSVQNLIDSIQEQLQDKRCFIVIDDLWEETAWDTVSMAFPESNNCSRIVATTENMNVALKCCGYMPDNILKMKSLGIQDSGNLFFNRIFGSEQQCPDELKDVSYSIVRKCGGLPLALINLAGLLASQLDYSELWYHVHDRLCSVLDRSHTIEEIQKQILNLCYNRLPRCLKTCLLYFNMYPEGYIMLKVHLVKQWIAEGFINATEGKDTEEIAENYFDELVNRGMIQPMKLGYNNEVLSCTVHHIILDLISHNSKEEEFLAAIDYSQTITGLAMKAHRLSFRFSSAKYAKQPAGITMPQLRSLGFFGVHECMPPIVEFKHLRVLILDVWGNHDVHMSLNLSGICRLFQLRYLKISSDIMIELPAQMQGLHYLETLEIDARISAVPLDIIHLPSLLHLGLRDAKKLPDEIGRIKSLSTLLYFDLRHNSEHNIWSLGKLTNLQHLHLTCSSALSGDQLKRKLVPLVSSLGKFGNLKSLILTPDALRTAIFFDISSGIPSPPILLQRLELLPPICFISRLPTWIAELHKLRILKIVVKELQGNDISNITVLPSLVVLSLYVRTAPTGTIIFSNMAFPALKYFKFTCGVMCLAFQAGAMPNLQRLKLCFNAYSRESHKRVLDGIEHLLNLQEVTGQIGDPPGADVSDRSFAKLSFEDTIIKHPRRPRLNIKFVDSIEEEYLPLDKLRSEKEGSSCEYEIIEKDCTKDTNKHADSRCLPWNAVMDQSPNPFNPPVPPPSKPRQMAASSNPWRFGPPPLLNARAGLGDGSLFLTSLPLLPHEKLNFPDSAHGTPSMDDTSAKMKVLDIDPEEKDYKFDFDLHQIDDLLPDEDELFAGITNEVEPVGKTSNTDSGGGTELDLDPLENVTASFVNSSIADWARGNEISPFGVPGTVGTVAGEHPYGEHPSRTLFVRNINSNVEDSELRMLFEHYGDIRTLYTATKHKGFVIISYFDIRSAREAMRALQNKPLRRRKLDIHFSIPKENPSDRYLNQGTLVISNLDPSVSNEEVHQIFGQYGEVKEIRETPNKKHNMFIEFYDVRAAEAALRSLNKSEIAGKRIKLEPSRPGGTRRNLMQQFSHDFDQEEPRSYRHPHVGSPIANSPPGAWAHYSSPTDNNMLQAFNRSPTGNGMSSIGMPALISNAVKIAPIGKDSNWSKYDQVFSNGNQSLGAAFQHSHSYQDRNSEHVSSSPGTLSGPQFLWGSPKPYSEASQSHVWRSPTIGSALSSNSRSQGQGFLHGSRQASLFGSSDHHHVGSAPSGVPFESHFGFLSESPETSYMKQVRFGNMGNIGTGRNGTGLMLNMASRASLNPVSSLSGGLTDNSSNFRPMLSPRLGHALYSNPTFQGPGSFGLDSSIDRARNRRVDSSALQADSKRQYQLDLERIRKGDDTRTTLMIKNIPNKYTSKMLLASIDELHKGTYDFFYLPIDFKNKCNVGYAFINMVSPTHIISFYQAFNGKKWEKFNSEKVASLAYARIQGQSALISHFQNSSLMNEDKRCRPILFHPNGVEFGHQEAFPINGICVHMPVEDGAGDSLDDVEEKIHDGKMGGESSTHSAGSL